MDREVVSQEDWLVARKALLRKELEEMRLRDEVSAARLAMPQVKIDKDYRFDSPSGEKSLSDLFDGRSQLLTYHFMLGPSWEEGCPRCSFITDHINGALAHLNNHGVTWTAVSRAPLKTIEAFKKRMNWELPWVSSFGSDFNYDFNVSFTDDQLASGTIAYNYSSMPSAGVRGELSGLSSFFKDGSGDVFHTYSAYSRGLETLASSLMALDLAPLGRNDNSPWALSFVQYHDSYETAAE